MVPMKNTAENRSMLAEIARLRTMTVAELRVRWRELYGEESRSRNKDFLWRRLAWRLQELAHGGLSDRARARIEELAPVGFVRAQVPRSFDPAAGTPRDHPPTEMSAAKVTEPRPIRDPRRPTPGTVLTRQYHGQTIRVVTLEDGSFEWDGRRFGSLSEIARAVTGARWNGRLWFGLTERKRKS